MPIVAPAPLTLDELSRRLRAVDPRVCLVPERILRRQIRQRFQGSALGLTVPHREQLNLTVAEALAHADPGELRLEPPVDPAGTLILLAQPSELPADPVGRSAVLQRCWRRLFHARVHLALDELRATGALDPHTVHDWIQAIGPAAFAEIREVLRREHLLLPPADDATVLTEFVAVFLEFAAFAPALIPEYFPALADPAGLQPRLAHLVDSGELLARCRPEGAPDPQPVELPPEEIPLLDEEAIAPVETTPSAGTQRESALIVDRLLALADAAERRSNLVRAVLLRTRAAALSSPARAGQARSAARAALRRLSERLTRALQLDPTEQTAWDVGLESLREPAARGIWPAEARVLYDLQAVCVDSERPMYQVDLVEWLLSRGQRPIRRPLPYEREVSERKHLARALGRLGRVNLAEPQRHHLAELLHQAIEQTETRLRDRVRPVIAATLQEAGCEPHNVPEQVAAEKLVEELLDPLVERGHIAFGELRDALSRNSLKLPDLTPQAFLRGDALLQADHRLSGALDGIYRRAEVYMRVLQKASSLAFGTPLGRLLVLWLVLPFGGAFVTLEGLQHLINPVIGFLTPRPHDTPHTTSPVPAPTESHEGPAATAAASQHVEFVHLVTWPRVVVLGLIVLLLLHSETARRWTAHALRGLVRGLTWLSVELPRRLADWPPFRALWDSPWFQRCRRWLIEPALITALLCGLGFPWIRGDWDRGLVALVSFIGVSALINSKPGLLIREEVAERLRWGWQRLVHGLLPGIYRAVMAGFHQAMEAVDRVLYTVDEWLRFRTGQSPWTLAVKAVLGVVWFAVTYLVRLVMNLLVEPQVNPIKHFPVVTVAHKLTLPFMLALPPLLMAQPLGMRAVTANGIAAVMQLLVPGIFGFLIWELKENWRLYEANRRRTLQPVLVGSHGETVVRLLRPGIHSGTLPKLYDRLRRAARLSTEAGDHHLLHRPREGLRHVGHAVQHFVERELIALTRKAPCLERLDLAVTRVDLATQQIAVTLTVPPAAAWQIVFAEQAGWLVGSVVDHGGLAGLTDLQRTALEAALAGLFRKAGVQLAAQQLQDAVWPPGAFVELEAEEVRVALPGLEPGEARFPLRNLTDSTPAPPLDSGAYRFDPGSLRFGRTPLTWSRWVRTWEGCGAGPTGPALEGIGAILRHNQRMTSTSTAGQH